MSASVWREVSQTWRVVGAQTLMSCVSSRGFRGGVKGEGENQVLTLLPKKINNQVVFINYL
jgi:hypothetical protein